MNPARLVRLIQRQARTYKLDGKDKLLFIKDFPDSEAWAAKVEALLAGIEQRPSAHQGQGPARPAPRTKTATLAWPLLLLEAVPAFRPAYRGYDG